jgi:hypothetical protein
MGCYGCRQGKKREGPNGAGKATKREGTAGETLSGNEVVVNVCNAETRGRRGQYMDASGAAEVARHGRGTGL